MSMPAALGSALLAALVLLPLLVAWVIGFIEERRGRRPRRQDREYQALRDEMEMYAIRRQRKNDAMRHIRAVARRERRSSK